MPAATHFLSQNEKNTINSGDKLRDELKARDDTIMVTWQFFIVTQML